MKTNLDAPAFPCMPIQDNLGRLVAPIPGFTKYEYVVLKIYAGLILSDTDDMYTCMNHAINCANIYFEQINKKEDDSTATIIEL